MYLAGRYIHIVAVIAWMAGILYLFRLFVYHGENMESSRTPDQKEEINKLLALMAYRLYKYITLPAMVVAFVAALFILYAIPGFLYTTWFWLKAATAVFLIGITFYAGQEQKRFALGKPRYGSKAYRVLNEVPTILMLIIVWAVIYKPN